MKYYLIEPVEAPWGDYGSILHHGMSMHEGRDAGMIRLERTGPEIFPITFPMDVIVTADFKRSFEASGLVGAEFRPVIKHRIVDLDWSGWDESEDEPPMYPDSGEPEDYILGRPHSPAIANAMPDLFELVLSEDPSADLFLRAMWVHAVSAKAKAWLQKHYGDYVRFVERTTQ